MHEVVLVGDIGGTHARYALVGSDRTSYQSEVVLRSDSFDSCEASIEHFLAQVDAPSPDAMFLAVAGPIVDRAVTFPNSHWRIQEKALSGTFDGVTTRLINDFEAKALSLPRLRSSDLVSLGGPVATSLSGDYCVGVIGPGTGLGAGGLMSRGGVISPIVSEGGHSGFAPQNEMQREILQILQKRFERVSNERVLSGHGLENIMSALCELHGQEDTLMKAADVFAAIDEQRLAAEAVGLLFQILGQVAGDFALSLGAFDGIYIGGGIMQRHQQLLQQSSFRSGFENKGRHRYVMEKIPTLLITHPQPGLLGAVAASRL